MAEFIPTEDFAERVMVQVRRVHLRQQRSLILMETLISMLPIRGLMAVAAVVGAIWNLVRIGMMLSPVICR
ncbi:MAG: hypothetical protein KJ630_01020 [Proteobacteria bacterium]|nr:hypothetical protein [Pseudomonadota bacterium]